MVNLLSAVIWVLIFCFLSVSGCQWRRSSASTFYNDKSFVVHSVSSQGKKFSNSANLSSKSPLERGVYLYHQKKYKAALKELSKAILENSDSAEAFYWRGLCKYQLGDDSGAKEDLLNAISKDYKGKIRNRAKSEYARLFPIDESMDRFKSKEAKFNRYLELASESARCMDYEKAREYLNKAYSINKEDPRIYDYLGMLYYSEHKFEKCVESSTRGLNLLKKKYRKEWKELEINFLTRRGAAYWNLKKYKKAIRDLDEVIKKKPHFAFAYYDRGRAYYGLGEYEKAKKDFEIAFKYINKESPTYLKQLQEYYDLTLRALKKKKE